jgi:MFS family permease
MLTKITRGIGSVAWAPIASCWGRAPVLFWSTLAGTLFSLGICITTSFPAFYALRALQGFCLSSVQGIGLAFINDMFFFHEQARKIGIWVAIFLVSPYLGSPFGNFIISGTGSYKGAFWLAFATCCLDMVLIILFADESWYRRDIPESDQPPRRSRLIRLVGAWRLMAPSDYFLSITQSLYRLWAVFVKPIMIPCMIY